jgi:hypothetical protein
MTLPRRPGADRQDHTAGSSRRTAGPPDTARSSTRAGAAWYVARLRVMPMPEVPFRLSEQLRRLSGRIAVGPRIPTPCGDRTPGLAEPMLSWGARPDSARPTTTP